MDFSRKHTPDRTYHRLRRIFLRDVPANSNRPQVSTSILWSECGVVFPTHNYSYLSDCYPRYVASVLAGNDFFGSMIGGFPLFSTVFFHNVGVGPACCTLGGIGILMLPTPFILYV